MSRYLDAAFETSVNSMGLLLAQEIVDTHQSRIKRGTTPEDEFRLRLAPTAHQIKTGKPGKCGYDPNDLESLRIMQTLINELCECTGCTAKKNAQGAITSVTATPFLVDWAYETLGKSRGELQRREVIKRLSALDEQLDTTGWPHAWLRQQIEAERTKDMDASVLTSSLDWDVLDLLRAYDHATKPIALRTLSIHAFGNSKSLEKGYLSRLIAMAQSVGAVSSTKISKTSLRELGLEANPQTKLIGGHGYISFDFGTSINLSDFGRSGFLLTDDNSPRIERIRRVSFILIIENETCFHALSQVAAAGELKGLMCIYGSGLDVSSSLELFLTDIAHAIGHPVPMAVWSDIDLGGFEIASRIKSRFPDARPLLMRPSDLDAFPDHLLLSHESDYWNKMRAALTNPALSELHDVCARCIERQRTLEQEVMLPEYAISRIFSFFSDF